ncbi:hypothetical protein [Candidatus Clostridium helianthi]|uniref:Tail fiber protein n=1 Tax=Candidatus Clostridium helianthi TaxID=3381660 RepID=A0ABW8SDZ6_9CLOT
MLTTTNYGLKKPEGTDVVNIDDFNGNADIIDTKLKEINTNLPLKAPLASPAFTGVPTAPTANNSTNNTQVATTAFVNNALSPINTSLSDIVYQTAGGAATAIALTIKGSLVNGYPITFIASSNNGGAATTINGKKLYKPGTTTSPNLTAGKAYTVWYNSTGDCFFIKASAEGTALAKDVRKNTTFSNDNDTGITGGLDLSLLVPGNIRAGITIDGVTGKSSVIDTADAVLDPQYLLTGYSGYDDGILKVGTMPNNGGVNKSLPINGVCTIPKGYHDGTGKVTQSIPTKAGGTINPSTSQQIIAAGQYLSGDQIIAAITGTANDADVVAGKTYNSAAGILRTGSATIASLGGRQFQSGSFVGNLGTVTINLPFKPSIVYMYYSYYGTLMKSVLFNIIDPNTFYNLSGTGTSVGSVGNNFFTRNGTSDATWYWYAWE